MELFCILTNSANSGTSESAYRNHIGPFKFDSCIRATLVSGMQLLYEIEPVPEDLAFIKLV